MMPAIYHACLQNNTQLVEILMENGANPNVVNEATNTTPFFPAGREGNYEMMKILLNVSGKYKHTFDWVSN